MRLRDYPRDRNFLYGKVGYLSKIVDAQSEPYRCEVYGYFAGLSFTFYEVPKTVWLRPDSKVSDTSMQLEKSDW